MRPDPYSDFAAWREAVGLNTYDAARVLGLSRQTIWVMEKQGKAPKLTVRLAMEAYTRRRADALAALAGRALLKEQTDDR